MHARIGLRPALALMAMVGPVLAAGCGGGDDNAAAPGSSTSATSPAPSYPPITTGSFANAGRLVCIGDIETSEVTAASAGSTLPTFSSADAVVAAEIEEHYDAETAVVVGPEERGTRYVLYDKRGNVSKEVVVGDTPEGFRVVLYNDCG